MNSLIYLFAFITFLSTLFGGFIILRYKKALPYFFAFAAGSLISVVFLDLLPESLEIANSLSIPIRYVMITIVTSFFAYSLLEKYFLTHHHHEGEGHGHIMGPIGAGSLIIHSFFDGAAIGLAFQVSSAVGLVVGLAVIFHDMTDGINTVVLMLKNKQKKERAIKFLVMDAIAPSLGILLTSFFIFPQQILVFLLAIFSGEFLYIGASSLLPETHHHDSKKVVIAMTLGFLLMLILTSLIA